MSDVLVDEQIEQLLLEARKNALVVQNGRPAAWPSDGSGGVPRSAEVLLAAEIAATLILNLGPLALAVGELAGVGLG
jgi:hypothetical protein